MIKIITVHLLTALLILSSQTVFAADPAVILKKTADSYKKLQSYQDTNEVTININAKGMQQKLAVESSMSVKRPNKVASVVKTGVAGLTFVSDGTKMLVYMPVLNKYAASPSPASFDEMAKDKLLGSQSTGPAGYLKLFGEDPMVSLMEGVLSVKLIGEEKLDNRKHFHILLSQENTDVELWIDAKTYLITKLYSDMTKMLQAQQASIPGMSDMEVTYEEVHKVVALNKQIPDTVFEFTPPADAKEVSDLIKEASGENNAKGETKKDGISGKPAQDFTIDGLDSGTTYTLSDFKGKVVLLDFFATWCPPCRKELPILQKLNDSYTGKDFMFIAVNSMEERQPVKDFIDQQKFLFPVALDSDGSAGTKFGVTAYPTLVLIDKNGVVRHVHVGFEPDIAKTLQTEIDALLK